MLAVNHYSQHYISECYKRILKLLDTYKQVVSATNDLKVIAVFEREFFNSLVVLLDAFFINRVRNTPADNQPDALNEVRLLCSSILNNEDIYQPDNRLTPGRSVLGFKAGETILLNESQFRKLLSTYFTEIEEQFFLKA
jgi:predicted RNA-binding protein